MKNKLSNIFLLAILFAGIVACGQRVAFDVFAMATDITPPVLKKVSFSPTAVVPGTYFVVTITASDDMSGVKSANIVLESPSEQYVLHAEPSSGDSNGNWSSKILMPAGSEEGTWKVKSVYLADNSSNDTTLYYDDLANYVFTVAGESSETVSNIDSNSICSSFNYGDWSGCQSDGTQQRSILSAYPLDCIGGSPVLTQNCVYLNKCNINRPYLDEQNKSNCTASKGTWDSSVCVCSCPTGYHLGGTSCVYNTDSASDSTSTDSTSIDSSSSCFSSSLEYSEWSECSDGTQTRTVAYLPSGCTSDDLILVRSCTMDDTSDTTSDTTTVTDDTTSKTSCNASRPYLDEQNKNNCTASKGTWDSSVCVCSCPTGYHFEGTGCLASTTIETTCQSFVYSDWSECVNGKQSRTITKKLPAGCTGGFPEEISRFCIVSTTCTEDKWVCGEWSTCSNGKQKRTCTLSNDCKSVANVSPATEQACVVQEKTNKTLCKYTYSDWSECTNSRQYRKILTRLPEGCTDTTTETLERVCIASDCQYTYSDWGSCIDGKKKRTVLFKYPSDCIGSPELEESCEVSEDQISEKCIKIGWNNKNDCQLYDYRESIVSDCESNNLETVDSCREYMLKKYGKPLKCNGIDSSACNNLINDVILSDLKEDIDAETRDDLNDVSGKAAVIDPESRTITVQTGTDAEGASQSKKVKVEEMPLASSNSGQVLVDLLPVNSESLEDNSSPVAISFDSDGDGLPDDIEKRLGTDFYKKDTDGDGINDDQELKEGSSPLDPLSKTTMIVLSGIDKAVVEGKPLEQPKYTKAAVSASLVVSSVETVEKNIRFKGKSEPNQVVTLFIYSVMPIVVTVQADSSGNWVYELDKTLVDGTHEAYVVINNDEGKIIEASLPTPFFIAEAQAVSVDNFIGVMDASQVSEKTDNMIILYVLVGVAIALVLVAAILIIRQKYSE